MTLIESLQQKRDAEKMSVRAFAKRLGISPRMWSCLQAGTRRAGGKTLYLVLQLYPELKDEVWEYVYSRAESPALKRR